MVKQEMVTLCDICGDTIGIVADANQNEYIDNSNNFTLHGKNAHFTCNDTGESVDICRNCRKRIQKTIDALKGFN